MCMINVTGPTSRNQHSIYTRLSRLRTASRQATTSSRILVIQVYKYCFKCDANFRIKCILNNQSILFYEYQQLKRQSYNDATNKVESDKNLKKRTSSYEDGSGERERIVKDSEGEI